MAGRPRVTPGEETETIRVRVSAPMKAWLKREGGGDVSVAVRDIFETARRKKGSPVSALAVAKYLNGLTPAERVEMLWQLDAETAFCWSCGKDGCGGICG